MSGKFSLFSSLVSNDAHQKGQVISICIVGELCVKFEPPFGKGGGECNELEGFNPPVRCRSLSPLSKGDFSGFSSRFIGTSCRSE